MRIAAWARLEAKLWILAFLGWAFERKPADGPNVFTHHKQAHWFANLSIIAFLLISEAAVVHIWLHSTGHLTAKWIVLAIHAYGMIWLLGDAQATRIYRSSLEQRHGKPILRVQVGIRGSAEIPVENIKHVDTGNWTKAEPDEALLALQGTANIKILLSKPSTIETLLSPPKPITTLLLQVDNPQAFKHQLEPSAA